MAGVVDDEDTVLAPPNRAPAHDRALHPPVLLVVGAPRSGTSLLYRALCLHPQSAWISNWHRRVPPLTVLARLDRLARHDPGATFARWFPDGNAYVYGRRRPPAERLAPAPVEGEPVLRALGVPAPGRVPDVADPVAVRRLRHGLHRLVGHAGGSVFVTKRIAHNRRLAWLAEALPSARVAVVTRDGRAVAASLAGVDWWPDEELWWADTTVAAWRASGRDPWEACARHWAAEVDAIDAGLAAFPRDAVLRITYEELAASPGATVARVARHGGLGADPAWQQRLAALARPGADDRWRRQLDPSALDTIERVLAEAGR